MRLKLFNHIKIVSIMALLMLFSSCAFFRPGVSVDVRDAYIKNVLKWKVFELSGIIQVNYSSFRFRKNINIIKNKDEMVLNIFDSGFFGLMNKPFLRLRINSEIEYRGPLAENTIIELSDEYGGIVNLVHLFDRVLDELSVKGDKVINQRKYKSENFTVFFDEDMELIRLLINNRKEKYFSEEFKFDDLEAIFVYSNRNLDTIEFLVDGENMATIYVDKLEFHDRY